MSNYQGMVLILLNVILLVGVVFKWLNVSLWRGVDLNLSLGHCLILLDEPLYSLPLKLEV